MGLTDRISNVLGISRAVPPQISFSDYLNLLQFSLNGNSYLAGALNETIKGHAEETDGGYDSLVQLAYRRSAVVFACELARLQLFSEARFQFQQMRNGRPGDLFGSKTLDILEHPWQTAITGDLLTRVLLDADFGGTAFMTRRRSGIRRLRPDWVTMILGSENDVNVEAGDIDAEVIGLAYYPGGKHSGRPPEFLQRSEVAIFAPIPDPLSTYRGMPWVMPVIREIIADKQMTEHKSAYLVNGATPNLTVAIDKDLKEAANPKAFSEWIEAFKKTNTASDTWSKYSTWYLAGGTTVTKVGSNMQEIDFKSVQGAGETRIAAAAGVPPVIVGLSEGLQAATYSNYGQARRRFADNTMRPLWRNIAGSLETIVPPPPGARLWYDDRDIQALAEDKKDLADVHVLETQQIRTLVDSGWQSDSVISAVTTGDWTLLKHTGLFSAQLQAPGSPKMPAGEVPGESPVGAGTKPEVLPAGDPSTKPVTTNAVTKREELMLGAIRAFAERPQPAMHLAIEAGAFTSPVTIAEGAVRSEVTVQPPDVHVAAPEVTVEAPEPAVVNVAAPEVHVAAPDVTVEAPVVNVAAPEVTVEAPDVYVAAAEPANVVVNVPEQRRTTVKTVKRDTKGQIVRIEESDGE